MYKSIGRGRGRGRGKDKEMNLMSQPGYTTQTESSQTLVEPQNDLYTDLDKKMEELNWNYHSVTDSYERSRKFNSIEELTAPLFRNPLKNPIPPNPNPPPKMYRSYLKHKPKEVVVIRPPPEKIICTPEMGEVKIEKGDDLKFMRTVSTQVGHREIGTDETTEPAINNSFLTTTLRPHNQEPWLDLPHLALIPGMTPNQLNNIVNFSYNIVNRLTHRPTCSTPVNFQASLQTKTLNTIGIQTCASPPMPRSFNRVTSENVNQPLRNPPVHLTKIQPLQHLDSNIISSSAPSLLVSAPGNTRAKSPQVRIQQLPKKSYACWNCQSEGHCYSRCPEPQHRYFCYKCGLPGTDTSVCPKCAPRFREQRRSDEGNRVLQIKQEEQLRAPSIYINVYIGEKKIN